MNQIVRPLRGNRAREPLNQLFVPDIMASRLQPVRPPLKSSLSSVVIQSLPQSSWETLPLPLAISAPARSLLGKCQDLSPFVEQRLRGRHFSFTETFSGGFFSSFLQFHRFYFRHTGKHKEAFSSACRLLENPSHPTEIREAAALISSRV